MKQQKIRGHHRIWNEIEQWRLDNLEIDLTDYLLHERNRHYAKIRIRPWNRFSLIYNSTPQPAGKTKQQLLNGLLDIYEEWKTQLETLGQPYYLQIWLFESRFSQSQVVCAIGDKVNFYDNTFYKPEEQKSFNLHRYGALKDRLATFTWEHCWDEDHFDHTTVGQPDEYASRQDYEDNKKWFDQLLKKQHRTTVSTDPKRDSTTFYSFKRGDLWLGGKH